MGYITPGKQKKFYNTVNSVVKTMLSFPVSGQ